MPTFIKFNLEQQSIELPGTRTAGATGHYRHSAFQDGLIDHIREAPHVKTLYDMFENSVKKYGKKEFLGHRPYNRVTKKHDGYVWQTFEQIHKRVNDFGSGLMHLNQAILGHSQLNRWSLGIWSTNRPEWSISEISCNYNNLVSVPLYDTLGPDAVEYVINHAEIQMVVCSSNHIATLLQNSAKLPSLRAIISMDSLRDDPAMAIPGASSAPALLRAWGAEKGIKVYDFLEMEALGAAHPRKPSPPREEEVASLCYTSGTTGQPKGAQLTHKNFIAAVSTNVESIVLGPNDTMISFLPLAHIMGRYLDSLSMYAGSRIGYFRGDILTLLDDVVELKPTFFPAVPRLLNKIYAKLVAATIEAPGLVGALARKAVAAKMANLEAGKGIHHPLWDRLLFNKVKMALGGNVQVIVTGSAPIAKEVLNFLRIAFGCVVLEGYGSTESMGTAMLTLPEEFIPGHVGAPRCGCDVKLVDVPEMNYTSNDKPFPRGEICLRGPHIFTGYFKDEEKTKEALDSENWLHTGDIGFVDNRGCFTIIDRKKNIFKLAQGEYVAPEKIENVLSARCNLVAQLFVHGESLESTLVAIAIPEPETFVPFATAITGGSTSDVAVLCKDPKVIDAFLKELEKAGKAGSLRGFEFVKKVHLSMDMFSIDNGLLTPTLKVRRPQVKDHFADQIKVMYDDLRACTPAAKL
ncbi:long-chain acyl-CoA synthetase [Entomortierella parvispora]|uniref:Long-chain-fatty-acid--CoA ligase n=1 Tax=Entomortierella parvispora TaxID=205924 RepID=A0A9P3LTX1_9FUNG|nr:long-chain acyl-CoA synthetase [Entomortierella parvispora]